MKDVVKQSATIIHISHPQPELFIEDSARICYASHNKTKPGSAEAMIDQLLKSGHGTPFEFVDIIVDLVTDLNTTHQIVRHRLCSYLQESKRYVRLEEVGAKFIEPVGFDIDNPVWQVWLNACRASFDAYCEMIAYGAKPQQARRVLPGSLASKIRMKTNIREWLHVLGLRAHPAADPQMYGLMSDLQNQFGEQLPLFFSH